MTQVKTIGSFQITTANIEHIKKSILSQSGGNVSGIWQYYAETDTLTLKVVSE